MASSPRASAAVPPEGEMEVDYGDVDPVEPEDEDWQVVTAEQEAQNLADAQADFLAGKPSDTLDAQEDLDEKMKIQMEDLQQTIGRLRLGAEANEQAEEWSRSLDSQAQSSEDVARADGYVEPRPKSKPMAGFVSATCTASLPQPIRFKLDAENHAFSKLVMFPESFPSIPNYLVNMLVGTDECELTELFARFMDQPLSGPAVTRIIEAYIPMKSMCDQEAVWGLNYTKGTPGLGSKPLTARDTGTTSYDFMCSSCHNVWAPKATKCFLCKKGEKIPYEAPGATLQVGDETWHMCPVNGKPSWVRRPGASGAAGPVGSLEAMEDSKFKHSIDATRLAQPPPATSTAAELTMADQVAPSMRLLIRDEILQQDAQDDVNLAATLSVEARQKDQGFQVFHPETAKVLDLQAQALKQTQIVLRNEVDQEEYKKQKRAAFEDNLAKNMAVLQPFQEGLQSVAASSVYSPGVDLLRKSNLEQVQAKLKEAYFKDSGFSSVKAFEQAQTTLAEAKAANKRMQDQGILWMKNHTLDIPDASVWPEGFKTKLEQGLFRPIDANPEDNRFGPAELNRQYISFMDKLNLGKNAFPPKLFDEMPDLQVQLFKGRAGAAGPSDEPEGMDYLDGDARNMAMILWAIKRHKGEQRMHSGVWKKVAWQHKPDWVGAPLLSPDQLPHG